jgi:hypothetical protein
MAQIRRDRLFIREICEIRGKKSSRKWMILADALTVIGHRHPLILQIRAQHARRIVCSLDWFWHDDGRTAEIINLFGSFYGVGQLLAGVNFQFPGDVGVFRPFDNLAVNNVGDNRLILPGSVFIEQVNQFFTVKLDSVSIWIHGIAGFARRNG